MTQGPYASLINWFARNSVAANLLMFAILVGGYVSVTRNVTFEVFRQEHVPECETVEELPDIFNDTTGTGNDTGEESDDVEEPLF